VFLGHTFSTRNDFRMHQLIL